MAHRRSAKADHVDSACWLKGGEEEENLPIIRELEISGAYSISEGSLGTDYGEEEREGGEDRGVTLLWVENTGQGEDKRSTPDPADTESP